MISERDFEGALLTILEDNAGDPEEDETAFERVMTFEDQGILTHNRGLVVRLGNGDEFQLTIVKSR
jgi:hypothetical protein